MHVCFFSLYVLLEQKSLSFSIRFLFSIRGVKRTELAINPPIFPQIGGEHNCSPILTTDLVSGRLIFKGDLDRFACPVANIAICLTKKKKKEMNSLINCNETY